MYEVHVAWVGEHWDGRPAARCSDGYLMVGETFEDLVRQAAAETCQRESTVRRQMHRLVVVRRSA